MTPCEFQREFFWRSVEKGQQLSLVMREKPILIWSRVAGEIFSPPHRSGDGPQHPQPERIRSTLEARHKNPLEVGLEQGEMKIAYALYF